MWLDCLRVMGGGLKAWSSTERSTLRSAGAKVSTRQGRFSGNWRCNILTWGTARTYSPGAVARQRMDALMHHHRPARQIFADARPGEPGERRPFDGQREMAFAARVVAGVADMLLTLVF